MPTQSIDHRFFSRVWSMKSARESQALRDLRRENLAGLSGRVLEVGAGTGTNFGFYPDTVREVIALEPEPRLFAKATHAANTAAVPVTVVPSAIETLSAAQPFDAVVCAFNIRATRHEWVPIPTPLPTWLPAPSSEFVVGLATKTD